MCDIDYCDGWTPLDYKLYRARKEHGCCACFRTIEKGQLYRVLTGITDGSFDRLKRCIRCDQIAEGMRARGCSVYFDLSGNEGIGTWIEDDDYYDRVGDTEPVAAIAFMTQDELEKHALEKKHV